jgi:hypothetical protein
MGLVNVAVAIYIAVFMGVLGVLCAVGYFKNFRGKEENQ